MNSKVWEIADQYRGHLSSDVYLIAFASGYLSVLEQEDPTSEILTLNIKEQLDTYLSPQEQDVVHNKIIKSLSLLELKDVLLHLLTTIDYSKQTMMASSNDSILNIAAPFFSFTKGTFADLCSGNGAMLSEALTHGAEIIKGIEVNALARSFSILRLWLEHEYLAHEDIVHADVFEYFDKHLNETYEEIFSQFPLGLIRQDDYVFEGITVSKHSDWGFISLVMNQLKEHGRAVVISSFAIETRKADEDIRKHFIEQGYLEEVIVLPAGILAGTNIPTFLLVLSHGNASIRFTDASEIYSEKGRIRSLTKEDVEQIHASCESQVSLPLEEVATHGRLHPAFYLLPELEEGVPLEDFVTVLNSRSIRKKEMDTYTTDQNTGIEFIRSSHVRDGKIERGTLVQAPIPNMVELEDKDVLVTRTGSNVTVALYRKDQMTSFVDENFFVLRVLNTQLDPYYLVAYLQSEVGEKYLQSNYSGVTIQRITKKDLLAFKVPLVDAPTQKERAKTLKQKMDEIATLERTLECLKQEKKDTLDQWFQEDQHE